MKKLIAYLRISALSGCAALAVSCTNYLDLNDPDSLSKGNFPTSIGHIDLLVNSVYGAQHHWCFLGNYWAGYVMYCLDHTIDLQWHNDQGWVDICSGAVKTGNNKVTDPWTALSMGVYYANTAMEEIDAYRAAAPASEAASLDNYEGECLFFRAFYRWHMLSLYGQPDMDGVGIPIIDKVPKTLEEMYVGRAKTGACYQAIIDDLDRAVGLLTQTDNHRVTVWSAKAFRAKACLFAGQNDKAKTDLEDCIHNSGKTLEPFERYRMMFNGYDEYEFNSESFYEMGQQGRSDQRFGLWQSEYGFDPFALLPAVLHRSRQHADGHVLRQPVHARPQSAALRLHRRRAARRRARPLGNEARRFAVLFAQRGVYGSAARPPEEIGQVGAGRARPATFRLLAANPSSIRCR